MDYPLEITKQAIYQAVRRSNLFGIQIGMLRAEVFSAINGFLFRGPILGLYVAHPNEVHNLFVRFGEDDRVDMVVASMADKFAVPGWSVLPALAEPSIGAVAIPISSSERIMSFDVSLCLGNRVVIDVTYHTERLQRLSLFGPCNELAFKYANEVATKYLNRIK